MKFYRDQLRIIDAQFLQRLDLDNLSMPTMIFSTSIRIKFFQTRSGPFVGHFRNHGSHLISWWEFFKKCLTIPWKVDVCFTMQILFCVIDIPIKFKSGKKQMAVTFLKNSDGNYLYSYALILIIKRPTLILNLTLIWHLSSPVFTNSFP